MTEIEAKDDYAMVHVEDIPDGIVNVYTETAATVITLILPTSERQRARPGTFAKECRDWSGEELGLMCARRGATSAVVKADEWPKGRVHAWALVSPVPDLGIEGVMAA